MFFVFTCSCGKALKVADQHAGKLVKCPACGKAVTAEAPPTSSGGKESPEAIAPAPARRPPPIAPPPATATRPPSDFADAGDVGRPSTVDVSQGAPASTRWLFIYMGFVLLILAGGWLIALGLPRPTQLLEGMARNWQDTTFQLGWRLCLTVLELTALVICLLKYRRTLWGQFVAMGLLIETYSTFFNLFHLLMLIGERERVSAGWFTSFVAVCMSYSFVFGFALIFLGVASVPAGSSPGASRPDDLPDDLSFQRRSPLGMALLLVFTDNLYFYWWLYHTVKELRQINRKALPFSPGFALALCFVPVFGYFWHYWVLFHLFRGVGQLKRSLGRDETGSDFSPGFAIILFTLFLFAAKVWAIVVFVSLIDTAPHPGNDGMQRVYLLQIAPACSVLVLAELLFVTAFVYVQRHINAIWSQVAALPNSRVQEGRAPLTVVHVVVAALVVVGWCLTAVVLRFL